MTFKSMLMIYSADDFNSQEDSSDSKSNEDFSSIKGSPEDELDFER